MNLPNYFLADLPSNAAPTPAMLAEACRTLKRNRQTYLSQRPLGSILNLVADLAKQWLDPDFPFRKMALENGPTVLGFSRSVLAAGLDKIFGHMTRESLEQLIVQDLGHLERMDRFTAAQGEPGSDVSRLAMARMPELLVHITAGTLPASALHSIVLGLVCRSAQFVKCASGASLMPRLFAHSIYQAEPKLGACLEIAEWKGGRTDLEQELFAEADCVTVAGSNETVASIRNRLPRKGRLVAYGHRVSIAYVSSGALKAASLRRTLDETVADVMAWDQVGCLSPQVIYVQSGGIASPEQFGEMLAEGLELVEATHPRGSLPTEEAAAITSRRSLYAVRAAYSPETRMWASKGSTAWTVVYEADPQFQSSCGHRFIYVKGVRDLESALRHAEAVRESISTIGLAAPAEQLEELASLAAKWGATRVCRLGQMQNPPLMWRHDGRPALGDLAVWTDWERG